MSLIYQHPNGGALYQAGAEEIPDILRKKNISLLILAAKEYQPSYISGTKGAFSATEIIYVPLDDTIFFSRLGFKKTVDNAHRAAASAAEQLSNGNNVLSTCWAGLNRSGLISGLAMKQLSNLPGKDIVRQIRKKRSWRALSNPLFARVVANS